MTYVNKQISNLRNRPRLANEPKAPPVGLALPAVGPLYGKQHAAPIGACASQGASGHHQNSTHPAAAAMSCRNFVASSQLQNAKRPNSQRPQCPGPGRHQWGGCNPATPAPCPSTGSSRHRWTHTLY
jgi:hypothetical protein